MRLSELCDINMGQSPKSEYYNNDGQGLPFLQGNRTFGTKYPIFDTYTTVATKIAEAGDVIMSVRAPVGDVNITPVQMCLGRGVCSLRHKDGEQEFLYYLMKHHASDLINRESGTVFGSVNRHDIANLEVEVPPLSEQIEIGRTLRAMDDKIENNSKINHHLEQIALAIYQERFGTSKPNGILGKIATISSGKRPQMKVAEKSEEINIPILGASAIMGYTDQILYSEKILVIGRVGTHGVIQRYNRPSWPSDNTLVLKSESYELVYQILRSIEFSNMNRGSTQPLITQTDLKNVPIYIPTSVELDEFETTVNSLMKQYEDNLIENESLASLRDTLLPKLIFGEISVTD